MSFSFFCFIFLFNCCLAVAIHHRLEHPILDIRLRLKGNRWYSSFSECACVDLCRQSIHQIYVVEEYLFRFGHPVETLCVIVEEIDQASSLQY